MSIEIPVEASLDDSDAQRKLQEFNQRLNDLQQKVAQANGVKIDPVSAKTVEQMNNMIKQFEVMKRLSGEMNRRIRDMGLIPGTTVSIVGRAPLKDPVALRLSGVTISLRNSEADFIKVDLTGSGN